MRSFLASVCLLTCLPLGRRFVPTEKELAGASFFFPLTGFLIAVVLTAAAWGATAVLPPFLCAAFLTFLSEVPAKGFHLDGLADTADGFLSGRTREKMLEIMRDSRIGTMGVLAVGVWMLLKFAAFVTLLEYREPHYLAFAVFFMTLYGRCAMVYHLLFSHYAREKGLGKLAFQRKPLEGAILGLLLSLTVLSGYSLTEWVLLLPWLLPVWGYLWSGFTNRKIGGGTGDTLGACEELTELLVLLYFAAAA